MRLTASKRTALCTAALLVGAGIAAAGDGNSADILQVQDSSLGEEGNSLSLDQTDASNSIVAGLSISGEGEGNSISLDISTVEELDSPFGFDVFRLEDPFASFDPNRPATQIGSGNSADIIAIGDGADIGLYQNGIGNVGTLTANGENALASLFQDGKDNVGNIDVTGKDSQGFLAQIGDDNVTSLNVDTDGASVSYTVEGDATNVTVPANVVSSSGSGQITITQTTLP